MKRNFSNTDFPGIRFRRLNQFRADADPATLLRYREIIQIDIVAVFSMHLNGKKSNNFISAFGNAYPFFAAGEKPIQASGLIPVCMICFVYRVYHLNKQRIDPVRIIRVCFSK